MSHLPFFDSQQWQANAQKVLAIPSATSIKIDGVVPAAAYTPPPRPTPLIDQQVLEGPFMWFQPLARKRSEEDVYTDGRLDVTYWKSCWIDAIPAADTTYVIKGHMGLEDWVGTQISSSLVLAGTRAEIFSDTNLGRYTFLTISRKAASGGATTDQIFIVLRS